MKSIYWCLASVLVSFTVLASPAAAKPGYGTLSGVILDPAGTPQMGATVWLISEDGGGRTISRELSNEYGAFVADHLKPGKYALRVSLTGFLPTMERHISVLPDLTTMLHVQMDSVFASLDTLRRKPDSSSSEPDDWKWVLRSSTASRTVLQWRDIDPDKLSAAASSDTPSPRTAHGLVQVTNGALRPGSPSSLPDAPASAMSYDEKLGNMGHLLLADQTSYERGTSEAFAGVWLPSGTPGQGSETIFVIHQSKFGENGVPFQEMRVDHTQQLALTDRVTLRAGAEYVHTGIVFSTSSLRPHAQLDARLAPGWEASFIVATAPDSAGLQRMDPLEFALAELDSLPTVLLRNGTPTLQGGLHEELSIKHKLGSRSRLEVAGFHDNVKNQAILGTGSIESPEFLQDAFSSAFLYDGGNSSSWGTRASYRYAVSENVEVAALYSWAGALTPAGDLDMAQPSLRDNIETRNHHSMAARVSVKLPRGGTQFAVSYKWVAGTTLTPTDAFGSAASQIDTNLHLSIRQPIPGLNGRWEALADFSNLLAQGYVTSLAGQDSRLAFAPVLRSFRGGVSFQF